MASAVAEITFFGRRGHEWLALEALAAQHKRDLGAAYAEIAVLRRQLERNGIEPDTRTGEEWLRMFQQAAEVLRAAQLALRELGTGKEMLEEFS
jgi:hypothetical protein